MLAKICSDFNKPDGQTYINNTIIEIEEFMMKLLVRKLPGVGKVNEQLLAGMGIEMCRHVIEKASEIYLNFTENAFDFLIRAAYGIALNTHGDTGIKKSLNIAETFPVNGDYEFMKAKVNKLCGELETRAKQ